MKTFDGIELLRKYRDGEVNTDTKIKSEAVSGTIYYMHIGRGANKILYEDNTAVSTGYLTNINNKFEIIEEEKEIEKLFPVKVSEIGNNSNKFIVENRYKINELIEAVNSINKGK